MNMLAANVLISPVTEVKRTYLDSCMIRVTGNDTLYLAWLHEVWVYPPMKFKNKKQEKFYWRTVRDVKKCLPYAKSITKDMEYYRTRRAARNGGARTSDTSLKNTRKIFGACMPVRA